MKETIPLISIVIPVFNEEGNAEILYRELRDVLDPIERPHEIIFVDDGSTDRTFNKLKELVETGKQSSLGHLRIVRFSKRFGQTAAMQAGFDFAKGQIIVCMDGDLQNDPADIPRLLAKLNEGYDLICGWRKNRQDSMTKIIPSRIANWLIRRFTGVPVHDLGCSLKAFSSPMIKSARLYSDMHRFIPLVTTLKGARMSELVVHHRPRKFGKTKYGLSRTWKVLFDLITLKMLTHFQDRPIRSFAVFAFLFFALGFILSIASIVLLLEGNQSLVFPAASFLSFFLAGSLISWGLLAEFLVKLEKQ